MGLYGPQQLFAILLLLCRNTDFAAYNLRLVGVWRSLVAHLHGVQGVEGSNPFTPTINLKTVLKNIFKTVFFCPNDFSRH